MRTRHPSLHRRVLSFADGATPIEQREPESGVDGWSSPAWLAADGQIVLHPSSMLGTGLRRRRIEKLTSDQIDPSVPRLVDVLDSVDRPANILLVVKREPVMSAISPVLGSGSEQSSSLTKLRSPSDLWIASADTDLLSHYRTRTSAQLVDWASTSSPDGGLERRVAKLHSYGIDAMALPHKEWTPGSIALCHRFGLMTYGWGCEYEREIAALIDIGVDAVQTSFPARLLAVIRQYM